MSLQILGYGNLLLGYLYKESCGFKHGYLHCIVFHLLLLVGLYKIVVIISVLQKHCTGFHR